MPDGHEAFESLNPRFPCHLCGSGPKLPQCDAAIHRNPVARDIQRQLSHAVGTETMVEFLKQTPAARLQEQAKAPRTTPTRLTVDLTPLVEVEEDLAYLREALEIATRRRLEIIISLREKGATLDSIGGVLGISKAGVGLLIKRGSEKL